jgi:CSLREA domain-containing protein
VGRGLAAVAIVGALAFALVAAVPRAGAQPDQTFTVTTTADTSDADLGDGTCADADSACSLRAALEEANALGGETTVNLPAGAYALTTGNQLFVTEDVTIVGAGARTTTIEQAGQQRVIEIGSSTTTMSGVTITGGETGFDDSNDPNAGVGGGVWVAGDGTLDLVDVSVSGNSASTSGGGIDSDGAVDIFASTIANNSVSDDNDLEIGGGIDDFGTSLTIVDSTIAGNSAGRNGGGLFAASPTTLVNDTIANNSSGNGGGGIYNDGDSDVKIANTILDGNTGGDCNAALDSEGNNISADTSCGLTAAGDLESTDAELGDLQDNGGQTDTLAIAAGTPAVDAANGIYCPTTDQRGISRPQGPACDIGAFELEQAAPPPPPPPPPAGPPALPAPSVGAPAATGLTDTTATIGDSIDPNGSPTFYVVKWGTTTAYGQQTGSFAAGSGTTAQPVSAFLQGLLPGTTYHVQVVATNPGGSAASPDASFTTTGKAVSPPPPPPVKGQSLDAAPFSGNVLINGKPLVAGELIPFGSIIDTTNGTVTLISVGPTGQLQSASFAGGIFQVVSTANGATQLVLTGGDFSVCKKSRSTTARGAKPKAKPKTQPNTTVVRSLWGNGHGSFTTKGRYAAATVRGTVWHTSDRCDGTNVTDQTGVIAVLDLVTGKTIVLTAPSSYLAQP